MGLGGNIKNMELIKKLNKIQQELKAPKNQLNSFGRYNYRSCEDILEAVKPLLGNLVLVISDEIINIGSSNYVKATATLSEGENKLSVSACAREAVIKKGMDDAQITGACSSYARKYALNGLFAIDDTKDADTQDNTAPKTVTQGNQSYQPLPNQSPLVDNINNVVQKMTNYQKPAQANADDENKAWLDDATFEDAIKKSLDAGIIKVGTPAPAVMAILRKKYKVAKKWEPLVDAEINKQAIGVEEIDVSQIPM